MHPNDLPDTSPVPLWPTPWYLLLIGFKKWFYYKIEWITDENTNKMTVNMKKIYVNSIHEIN